MNRRLLGIFTGVLIAAVLGVGIFFQPDEPLKTSIFLATMLKGGLMGLMIAALLRRRDGWRKTLLAGAAVGALWGLVIALAKGFSAAPIVVPASAVEALAMAAILKRWGYDEPA